jgi:hypothetical protein
MRFATPFAGRLRSTMKTMIYGAGPIGRWPLNDYFAYTCRNKLL